MKDDQAILQMLRILPLTDAIHREARVAISGGGGIDAADYCINRLSIYVQKVMDVVEDDLLTGLKLTPSASSNNEEKMQQVVMASAELQAYLRQRIGISVGNSGQLIGTIINQSGQPIGEEASSTE